MAVKRAKKVLIIGVGRFGGALADELWQNGCDLIVVDKDAEVIDAVKSKAGAAFIADATDPAVLENIGGRDVDVAVVTAGESFEGVVLCVSLLAELGVKVIFARAANDRQASVLRDFATHFRVMPWSATPSYAGKVLSATNFRRFEINVLGWFGADAEKPRLNFPAPDYQIEAGHTLLLVGEADAIERFFTHADG